MEPAVNKFLCISVLTLSVPFFTFAEPFSGTLPEVVRFKDGRPFWCDAQRQMNHQCTATESSDRSIVLVHAKPSKDCPGGRWGWISIVRSGESSDVIVIGYTITPDDHFNVSPQDMCRPETHVSFLPNTLNKNIDDLVVFYKGKELFRYKGY